MAGAGPGLGDGAEAASSVGADPGEQLVLHAPLHPAGILRKMHNEQVSKQSQRLLGPLQDETTST